MPQFHQRLQRLEHQLNPSPLAELQALSDAELEARLLTALEDVLATEETDAEIRTHSAALLALMQAPPADPTLDRQGQLDAHRTALLTYLRANLANTDSVG